MTASTKLSSTVIRALCAPGLVLAIAGMASISVTMPIANARPQDVALPPINLIGTVRDFPASNLDFTTVPSEGYGQYVGIVQNELGEDGNPVYDGDIHRVLNDATTVNGQIIAPSMANFTSGLTNFTIVDGRVIVHESFVAGLEVLAVDISTLPVTMLARTDTDTYEPFGPYDSRSNGNINDSNNPRSFSFPDTMDAGTTITIAGRSWNTYTSSMRLEADTSQSTPQVFVLRNGDPVPDIDPYGDQESVASIIGDFVDEATNTVTIEDYQIIYLFELYTTDMSSEYADFQDMVVLLSLGTGGQDVIDGWVTSCAPLDDVDAELSPIQSDGGLQDEESFRLWFNDSLGDNISMPLTITLQPTADGTYLFDDTLQSPYTSRGGFYPIDDQGFGNENEGEHNHLFTYELETWFTYDSAVDPFISVASNADVWLFINGTLVIDMGGVHGQLEQRIDPNRLCLTEGEDYSVFLFIAQRNPIDSSFRFETNLNLQERTRPLAFTSFWD